MKVCFLGVGEACDADHPNTAILVTTDIGQALLDCGFTAPHAYFALCKDANELDALWISHFHGDHFFGVPLLLLRFWEMGRKKPLVILGPPGIEDRIAAALSLAYPSMRNHLDYTISFVEMAPGIPVNAAGMQWRTAANDHSIPCLSLRLDGKDKSLFYSGDGRPTPATLGLAKNSNLIIHEAFRVSGDTPGHGTISGCLDFAVKAEAGALALVHIQREERQRRQEIDTLTGKAGMLVFIPRAGDVHTL